MSERSHFLVLLSQTGWDRAELGNGRVEAIVERGPGGLHSSIFENDELLSRIVSRGASAREILGAMRVSEGIWLDALGEEAAWAKSLETLMGMTSLSLAVDAPMPAGDAFGPSLARRPAPKGEA